jgi:hypothetical protein
MARWWNGKLMKWQVDKMASWQNGKLTKTQVDKMAGLLNGKMTILIWKICRWISYLTKWQVEKVTSWQNGKLTKEPVDLMAQHLTFSLFVITIFLLDLLWYWPITKKRFFQFIILGNKLDCFVIADQHKTGQANVCW